MRESIPVTSRLAPLKANNEAASHAKYSNLVESVRKLYSPDQLSVEVMGQGSCDLQTGAVHRARTFLTDDRSLTSAVWESSGWSQVASFQQQCLISDAQVPEFLIIWEGERVLDSNRRGSYEEAARTVFDQISSFIFPSFDHLGIRITIFFCGSDTVCLQLTMNGKRRKPKVQQMMKTCKILGWLESPKHVHLNFSTLKSRQPFVVCFSMGFLRLFVFPMKWSPARWIETLNFNWKNPVEDGCWRWEVKFGIRAAKKSCFSCGKMTIPRLHRIPSSPDFGSLLPTGVQFPGLGIWNYPGGK